MNTKTDSRLEPCGYCRRCALHDDPAGCLTVEAFERGYIMESLRRLAPQASFGLEPIAAWDAVIDRMVKPPSDDGGDFDRAIESLAADLTADYSAVEALNRGERPPHWKETV